MFHFLMNITSSNNLGQDASVNKDDQIKFVFSIFRHGARSPSEIVNNKDEIGGKWENINQKELTNVGMRQHYILGLEQGNLYREFLTENYKPGDIYALTTNTERTLLSYISFQQGLFNGYLEPILTTNQIKNAYPPNSKGIQQIVDIANKSNKPVGEGVYVYPFHTLMLNKFFVFDDNCTGLKDTDEDEFEDLANSSFKEVMKKWETYLNKLGLKCEQDESDLSKLKEFRSKLSKIRDSYVADYYGRNLPSDIFGGDTQKEISFINDLQIWLNNEKYFKIYKTDNEYNAKILLSRLFDLIINQYFKNRVEKEESNDSKGKYNNKNPKLLLYSMHDTELLQIMVILKNLYDIKTTGIDYAASYNFELIKTQNSKLKDSDQINDSDLPSGSEHYDVVIRYNLKVIHRESLEKFSENFKKIMLPNETIDSYCQFVSKSKTLYIVAICCLSVGIILLIIYIFFIISSCRKAKSSGVIETNSHENILISAEVEKELAV